MFFNYTFYALCVILLKDCKKERFRQMTDKYLHPDKNLAVKYVIAAFLLYILDYLIPMLGLISIILLFIGIRAFQNDENNHFKTAYKSLKK